MGALNGIYWGAGPQGTLNLYINDSNDSNGLFSGQMTQDKKMYDVNGHYHFENSVGPKVSISFLAVSTNDSQPPSETWSVTADELSCPLLTGSRTQSYATGAINYSVQLQKR